MNRRSSSLVRTASHFFILCTCGFLLLSSFFQAVIFLHRRLKAVHAHCLRELRDRFVTPCRPIFFAYFPFSPRFRGLAAMFHPRFLEDPLFPSRRGHPNFAASFNHEPFAARRSVTLDRARQSRACCFSTGYSPLLLRSKFFVSSRLVRALELLSPSLPAEARFSFRLKTLFHFVLPFAPTSSQSSAACEVVSIYARPKRAPQRSPRRIPYRPSLR